MNSNSLETQPIKLNSVNLVDEANSIISSGHIAVSRSVSQAQISFYLETISCQKHNQAIYNYKLTVQNSEKKYTYLVPDSKIEIVCYYINLFKDGCPKFRFKEVSPPVGWLSHTVKYFYIPVILFCFADEQVCCEFFNICNYRSKAFTSLIHTCDTLKRYCDANNGAIDSLRQKVENCYKYKVIPYNSLYHKQAQLWHTYKNSQKCTSFLTSFPFVKFEFHSQEFHITSPSLILKYELNSFESAALRFYQSIVEKYQSGKRECNYVIPSEFFYYQSINNSFYLPCIIFYFTDIDFCQKFINHYIAQSLCLTHDVVKKELEHTIEILEELFIDNKEELNQLKYKIQLTFDKKFVEALRLHSLFLLEKADYI